jgi:hypothetical protein
MTSPRHTADYSGPERREPDAGAVAGLPWLVKAIGFVGFPAAIAAYLIYIGAASLPTIQASMQTLAADHKRTLELVSDHIRQQEDVLRMLQRVCSNTAKNDVEKQRCFDR